MIQRQQIRRAAGVFIPIALVLAACGNGGQGGEQSTLDRVLERGTVILAVTGEVPPLGFPDEEGNLQGFEIDIGRMLANQLFGDETKVEFQRTAFDARWDAVNNGLVDAGIMGTTITAERALRVAFTSVYLDSGFGVLVPEDSEVETFAELNSPDVTIALQDQANAREAKDRLFPEAQEFIGSGEADLVVALQSGRADAAFQGKISALYYVSQPDSGVRYLDEELVPPTRYGIFSRPDDFEWWRFLDEFVREMRSGSLYTEYAELHRKWLGVDPPPQNWYLDQ